MSKNREDAFKGRLPQVSLDNRLSIHSSTSINFMKEIGAPLKVLTILELGYKLPLPLHPPPYYEQNNGSALNHIEFLRSKIDLWESKGYCHKVPFRPHITSPLSVVSKLDLSTGETKLRPCLDASRHLNNYLVTAPVKLADLKVAEKLLEPDDYMAAYDLENMYFHVNIHEDHHKYLGFQIPCPETGNPQFYCFSVLIYGLAPAVSLVTLLTKPIIQHINKKGIRSTIFIDDGRTLGRTLPEASSNHIFVLQTLQNAGWNIQTKKTSQVPTQSLYHQGFTTDTKQMTYSIPDFKLQDIQTKIQNLNSPLILRNFCQLVGKLSSVERAIGPFLCIFLRSSHQVIAKATEDDDEAWDKKIHIPNQVFQDLLFLGVHMSEYNSQPIVNSSTGFCLNPEVSPSRLVRQLLPFENFGGFWSGDASNIQSAAFNILDPREVHVEYFSEQQQSLSSTSRELVTIESTLARLSPALSADNYSLLYWMTDSQVLCTWLTKGTAIETIRHRLVQLFKLLHSLKIRLEPIWVPRTHFLIQLADAASKFKDTDDWGLNKTSFRILEQLSPQKFSLDAFANCTNKHVDKFFSKTQSPGSSGVNAFMQDWSTEFVYACPPVNLVIDVYRHIVTVPCRGVLVVPKWPTNIFWSIITSDGTHLAQHLLSLRTFRPVIRTGRWSDKHIFHEHPRPIMLAIHFDSFSDTEMTSLTPDRCILGGCERCS